MKEKFSIKVLNIIDVDIGDVLLVDYAERIPD